MVLPKKQAHIEATDYGEGEENQQKGFHLKAALGGDFQLLRRGLDDLKRE